MVGTGSDNKLGTVQRVRKEVSERGFGKRFRKEVARAHAHRGCPCLYIWMRTRPYIRQCIWLCIWTRRKSVHMTVHMDTENVRSVCGPCLPHS